jgi:hypothetical protein
MNTTQIGILATFCRAEIDRGNDLPPMEEGDMRLMIRYLLDVRRDQAALVDNFVVALVDGMETDNAVRKKRIKYLIRSWQPKQGNLW